MKWRTVRGSQPEKPKELEIGSEYVFMRKNIHEYSEEDSISNQTMTGWEYDEQLLTRDEYEKLFKNDINARLLNIETFIATQTESS